MRFGRLNTIRTKLVVSLVTICAIPLIITGITSYNQSKKILNDKLTLTSTQTLAEMNTGLMDYFDGFSNIVTMTSTNPAIVKVDLTNANVINEIMKSVKDSDSDILDIYYGTVSKDIFIYLETKLPDGYDQLKEVGINLLWNIKDKL